MDYYLLKIDSKYFAYLDIVEKDSAVSRIIRAREVAMNSRSSTSEADLMLDLPKMDFMEAKHKLPKHVFKATSWIGRGIVIDLELYNKLKYLNWAKHICNPLEILYRKKILTNYVHIYFTENCISYSDWRETTFYDVDKELNKIKFKVDNLSHLEAEKNFRNTINIERCTLSSSFPRYDIFGLFFVENEIYFSHRVKEIFEELKIPEVQFENVNQKVKLAGEGS